MFIVHLFEYNFTKSCLTVKMCCREEKERFIKAKYERKEFLKPLPPGSGSPAQNLIDSVCR